MGQCSDAWSCVTVEAVSTCCMKGSSSTLTFQQPPPPAAGLIITVTDGEGEVIEENAKKAEAVKGARHSQALSRMMVILVDHILCDYEYDVRSADAGPRWC